LIKEDNKITIVIPCFNSGRTIEDTLKSIECQTYSNNEVIIVNDGSNDEYTISKLRDIRKNYHVIDQKNKGLSAARNKGISLAKNGLILPLDADDCLEPNFISESVNLYQKYQNKVFVFSEIKCFGDIEGVLNKKFNFFDQLFFNQLPYCILFSKFAWEEVGGYDEKMREGYEDWDFNLRLANKGYIGVSTQKPLFNYRVSNSGMLKNISTKKHAELWDYIQKKNQDIYSLKALMRIYRESLNSPKNFKIYNLITYFFIFKVTPKKFFNFLFKRLLVFSSSSKLKK